MIINIGSYIRKWGFDFAYIPHTLIQLLSIYIDALQHQSPLVDDLFVLLNLRGQLLYLKIIYNNLAGLPFDLIWTLAFVGAPAPRSAQCIIF